MSTIPIPLQNLDDLEAAALSKDELKTINISTILKSSTQRSRVLTDRPAPGSNGAIKMEPVI